MEELFFYKDVNQYEFNPDTEYWNNSYQCILNKTNIYSDEHIYSIITNDILNNNEKKIEAKNEENKAFLKNNEIKNLKNEIDGLYFLSQNLFNYSYYFVNKNNNKLSIKNEKNKKGLSLINVSKVKENNINYDKIINTKKNNWEDIIALSKNYHKDLINKFKENEKNYNKIKELNKIYDLNITDQYSIKYKDINEKDTTVDLKKDIKEFYINKSSEFNHKFKIILKNNLNKENIFYFDLKNFFFRIFKNNSKNIHLLNIINIFIHDIRNKLINTNNNIINNENIKIQIIHNKKDINNIEISDSIGRLILVNLINMYIKSTSNIKLKYYLNNLLNNVNISKFYPKIFNIKSKYIFKNKYIVCFSKEFLNDGYIIEIFKNAPDKKYKNYIRLNQLIYKERFNEGKYNNDIISNIQYILDSLLI